MIFVLIVAAVGLPIYALSLWVGARLVAAALTPLALTPPPGPAGEGERVVWKVPQTTPAQVRRAVTALVVVVGVGWGLAMGMIASVETSRSLAPLRDVQHISSDLSAPRPARAPRPPSLAAPLAAAATACALGVLATGLVAIVAIGRRRWAVVSADPLGLTVEGSGAAPVQLPWSRVHGIEVEVDGLRIDADRQVWVAAPTTPPDVIAGVGSALERARRLTR